MWYPLLLLAIALLCLFWKAHHKPKVWNGSPRTAPSDRPYLWEYEVTSKNIAVASRIGISAKTAYSFIIEKERFTHRITKNLGFCTEFQTENMEFDTRAYILSDDPKFQQKLQASTTVQRFIVQAFAQGVREIRATATHLIARLDKTRPNPPQEDVDMILDTLHALKAAFEGVRPPKAFQLSVQRTTAHVFKRLPVCLLVATFVTLTLNLVLGFQVIEWEPMLPLVIKSTAIFVVVGIIAMWVLFRHSAYGHKAFIGFIRLSSWSAALCSFVMLWFINCYYDTSQQEARELPVLEKHITISKKSKSYHVQVADWTAHKQTITVQINEMMYTKLQVGEQIRILSRSGALGMQWIAKVEQRNNDTN